VQFSNFAGRDMDEEWLIQHVLGTDNEEITVCGSKVEHQGGTMSTTGTAFNQRPQGQVPHAHMSFISISLL
jgi:hypothetical protein